ncbi:putative chemotaxis MotD protein [Rhodopseudomonas palustris BisB18]|uniref:Putative chemotaxis MotD protein n=2 Tax=Rhodopseudomonas palustris TaxID=1076 RepID=Q21AB3_RHOPB
MIAQAAKPGAKAETPRDSTEVAIPDLEMAVRGAEPTDDDAEVSSRPKNRAGKSAERAARHAASEVIASLEGRSPDAALSAMIAKFDQPAPSSAAGDDAAPPLSLPQLRAEPRDASLTLVDAAATAETAPSNDLSAPRVALSIDTAEARPLPVKVAVRDQETHFAPVQQLTQLQKIVDRMSAELPAASAPIVGTAADAAPSGLHKASDGPVKILTLQLEPPDLGAVTVKMRLAGDAVEIRLTAERADTARMLQHERGTLTDIMQSAGYKFDIAAIDHSRAADSNAGSGQQQPQPDQRQPQQSPGGSPINFAESGRQSNDAQSGPRHNRQQHEQFTEPADRPQDNEVVRDRAGGAVYL